MTPSELEQIRTDAGNRIEAAAKLAQRICEVPAPTGSEQERAEFVASLWRERGYTPEIDPLGNVYIRRGHQGHSPVLMLLAHTDTVFPRSAPSAATSDGDSLRGPGIVDNSSRVSAMIKPTDIC